MKNSEELAPAVDQGTEGEKKRTYDPRLDPSAELEEEKRAQEIEAASTKEEEAETIESTEKAEENPEKETPRFRLAVEFAKKIGGAVYEQTGAKEKVDNFFLGRDVAQEMRGSAIFVNREKQLAERTGLVREIAGRNTLIQNFDSYLRQYDAKLTDAVRIRKIRIDLAEGDNDLTEMHEAAYKEETEKIATIKEQIEKDKARIVKEKEELEAKKKTTDTLIQGDNEGMRAVIDEKVTIIKAETGYDDLLERKNTIEQNISEVSKEAQVLESKIGAFERTIEGGGYAGAEIGQMKIRLRELREKLKGVNTTLSKATKSKNEIAKAIGVFDVRIEAVTNVRSKLGFEDSKPRNKTETASGGSSSSGSATSIPSSGAGTQGTSSSEKGITYSDLERLGDNLKSPKETIKKASDEKTINEGMQKAIDTLERAADGLKDGSFSERMKNLRLLRGRSMPDIAKKKKEALKMIMELEHSTEAKSLEEVQ